MTLLKEYKNIVVELKRNIFVFMTKQARIINMNMWKKSMGSSKRKIGNGGESCESNMGKIKKILSKRKVRAEHLEQLIWSRASPYTKSTENLWRTYLFKFVVSICDSVCFFPFCSTTKTDGKFPVYIGFCCSYPHSTTSPRFSVFIFLLKLCSNTNHTTH